MEGFIAPRELTAHAADAARRRLRRGSDDAFELGVARAEDEGEVRALLRDSAFAGSVSLSLEREPDSSLAASIEGDVHHMMVARHKGSGDLAATASRSVRDVFLNGEASRLGYLGQLRIGSRYRRHRGLLDLGFGFCRRLHASRGMGGGAQIYLASVVSDNMPARRLLSRGGTDWPRFEPIDTLMSLAIPVAQRVRPVALSGVEIRRGSADLAGAIADCLRRNGPRSQFCPCWTKEDLSSTTRARGLRLDDFIVAVRGDTVIGCVACWDQRAFKQVIVRGYSNRLSKLRPLINVLAPALGSVKLPRVGTELQFAYVSHVAIDEIDAAGDLFASLLVEACRYARTKSTDYVALGLSARSALLPVVLRTFRARSYESVLYVAFWSDGAALASVLDGRPSYPELAIL